MLLLLRERDERYERAALRWLGRLLAEDPAIGFQGAGDGLEALKELGGAYANVARARLALVLRRVGEVRAAEVLECGQS